jgi:hypothetical protein
MCFNNNALYYRWPAPETKQLFAFAVVGFMQLVQYAAS